MRLLISYPFGVAILELYRVSRSLLFMDKSLNDQPCYTATLWKLLSYTYIYVVY